MIHWTHKAGIKARNERLVLRQKLETLRRRMELRKLEAAYGFCRPGLDPARLPK